MLDCFSSLAGSWLMHRAMASLISLVQILLPFLPLSISVSAHPASFFRAAVVWVLIKSDLLGISLVSQTRALVQSHRPTMAKCAGYVDSIKKIFKKSLLLVDLSKCKRDFYLLGSAALQVILFIILASCTCMCF